MKPLSREHYRLTAVGFAILFAIVVAMGWVPGWYHYEGSERMLFGLFALSALDDITHGITSIAFAVAAFGGPAGIRLAYVTFGSYYALDALFFLSYGTVNDKTWIQNILLNAPHVAIGGTMLLLAYRLAPDTRRAH